MNDKNVCKQDTSIGAMCDGDNFMIFFVPYSFNSQFAITKIRIIDHILLNEVHQKWSIRKTYEICYDS